MLAILRKGNKLNINLFPVTDLDDILFVDLLALPFWLIDATSLMGLQDCVLAFPPAPFMLALDCQIIDDFAREQVGLQLPLLEGILAQGADEIVFAPAHYASVAERMAAAESLRILKNLLANGAEKMGGYKFFVEEEPLSGAHRLIGVLPHLRILLEQRDFPLIEIFL